jgi:hypothetical protein
MCDMLFIKSKEVPPITDEKDLSIRGLRCFRENGQEER